MAQKKSKVMFMLEQVTMELKVKDWVFVDNRFIAKIIEIKESYFPPRCYIIHVIEHTDSDRKPIVRSIGYGNDIIKVAKGSKLQTLLVLHGHKNT